MQRTLCTVITEKVDCISIHASKCLAPERVDLMRMNFLSSEISKSNRNYDMLGQNFVNSCPVLRNYQAEFVQNTFGSSRCGYEQEPIIFFTITGNTSDTKFGEVWPLWQKKLSPWQMFQGSFSILPKFLLLGTFSLFSMAIYRKII